MQKIFRNIISVQKFAKETSNDAKNVLAFVNILNSQSNSLKKTDIFKNNSQIIL
jgi:hypothetical protein